MFAGWTDENMARLTVWITVDGLSFGDIGKKLGCGRSAVGGKAKRMGLKGAPNKGRPYSVTPRPLSATPKPKPRKRVKPPTIPAQPIAEPNRTGVLLEDLNPHSCRWVLNDRSPYLFCGQDCESGSYCGRHALRVYSPPR